MTELSLLLVLLTMGCAPIHKFASNEKKVSGLQPKDRKIFTVTCDSEVKEDKKYNLPHPAGLYDFQIEPTCSLPAIEKTVDLTQPVNILFVVDITGSMKTSLDSIKSGLHKIQEALDADRWKASWGAIGFVDDYREFEQVEFTSADKLLLKMNDWKLRDGRDYAEAGQLALRMGVQMLHRYQNEHAEDRKNAKNVIVYVTDAQAHNRGIATEGSTAGKFTTDDLIWFLQKEIKDGLKGFEILYSIPPKMDPKQKDPTGPEPREQLADIIERTGIPGKDIAFPITTDALDQFKSNLVKITEASPLQCYAASAALVSQSQTGIPSSSEQKDILAAAQAKTPLHFVTSADAKVTQYVFSLHRCCKEKAEETTCAQVTDTSLNLTFTPGLP